MHFAPDIGYKLRKVLLVREGSIVTAAVSLTLKPNDCFPFFRISVDGLCDSFNKLGPN
jgi:hypothetical protein